MKMRKFGLIGYPLGHSISPIIHQAGFKSLGIDAQYDIMETSPEKLVDRLKQLKHDGYEGFNVTIPLKLPMSLFVHEVDAYADITRAINTVVITPDKTLKGYNTDVMGFLRAIPCDIKLTNKKIGILGTGGAAHAVVVGLAQAKVSEISLFTRNIPNSVDIVGYFRRKFPNIIFNIYQIDHIRDLSEYDMIVNTTPIGMLGHCADMMPLEFNTMETINKNCIIYDVIYNPKKTLLIKSAEKLGLKTICGLDMLIHQAVCAQKLWLNRTPNFDKMKISALENL